MPFKVFKYILKVKTDANKRKKIGNRPPNKTQQNKLVPHIKLLNLHFLSFLKEIAWSFE